jgi:hypothetical protein
VEEARQVLERLDRVEQLHLAGAPAATLLDELRALIGEAEEWLAAESPVDGRAADAVDRCRAALEGAPRALSPRP